MKNALFAVLFIPTIANAGYIGASAGQGKINASLGDVSDERSTTYGAFIGADYDGFAIEAGYIDFGSFSGISYDTINDVNLTIKETIDVSSLYVSALAKLPIGNASLFARAGIGLWSMNINVPIKTYYLGNTMTFPGGGSDSGFGPIIGLGIIGNSGKLSVRVEYLRFGNIGDGTVVEWPDISVSEQVNGGNIDVFQVSAAFAF